MGDKCKLPVLTGLKLPAEKNVNILLRYRLTRFDWPESGMVEWALMSTVDGSRMVNRFLNVVSIF
jgi:hypothetical protein